MIKNLNTDIMIILLQTTMAQRIPNNVLSQITSPFTAYPQDLIDYANAHTIPLPNLTANIRGQALALMAQPNIRQIYYFEREDTTQFYKQIGFDTRDSIQGFNKDLGLKRLNLPRGQYCLQYPYIADTTHIDKRNGAKISGPKDTIIDQIKMWWRTNLTDVPNDKWQVGHLDPTVPDATETNLAWQPPLQHSYRNRFKWDSYFHRMWPTGEELKKHWDTYYTKEEQKDLLLSLQSKLQ
jgi:hypothetical protein